MADNMKDLGNKINFMEKVFILGLMEESTTASMRKTRRQATVYISGQMEEFMRETGMMESSMDRENSLVKRGRLK